MFEIDLFDNSGPRLVAEISANHDQDMVLLKESVLAAKEFGADAVKIQTYEPGCLIPSNIKTSDAALKGTLWEGQDLNDLYQRGSLPFDCHEEIFDFAKRSNIFLFSSPFSASGVDLLESLGCPMYKIASFEMTDRFLIDRVASTKKPFIISTGVATKEELNWLKNYLAAKKIKDFMILHCVSRYPHELRDSEITSIHHLLRNFKNVGFSDHTCGDKAAFGAVLLGANLVEKHFALPEAVRRKTLDYQFSVMPTQLKELKQTMIDAWHLRKAGSRYESSKPSGFGESDLRMKRSLYFRRSVEAGHIIKKEDLTCLRPNLGTSCIQLDEVLGETTSISHQAFDPVIVKNL